MRACADAGVATTRVGGRSGVWVPGRPERKIAAIGIRVSRGVTMHGFALNCDCDLDWFSRFVPCGIRDAGVTSLSAELGRPARVQDMLGAVERHLAGVLGAARWPRSAMNPAPVYPAVPACPARYHGSSATCTTACSPLSMSRTVTAPASSS